MCEGWESERVMISEIFLFVCLLTGQADERAGCCLCVCMYVCMGLFCHNLIGKEKEEDREKKS